MNPTGFLPLQFNSSTQNRRRVAKNHPLLFLVSKCASEVRIDHDLPNCGVAVRGIRYKA